MSLAFNWPLSFEQPAWLWLLLVIPAIAIISRRSLAGLEPHRRILAVVFRSAVIAMLALALARIQFVRRNEHVAVMFVMDKSHSIPDDRRTAAEQYVRKVINKTSRDDRVGVITFDGKADVDLIPSRGGDDQLGNNIGFGMTVQPDASNLAGGVRLALAALPEGFKRRIVLMTDGNQNVGNIEEEIGAASASGVAIDVIPLTYSHDSEILLDRIVVPSQAAKDTRLPIRIIAKSKRPTRARLTLYHNGQAVPLPESEFDIAGGMQPTVIKTSVEIFSGGFHIFDTRLTAIDQQADKIMENNRATAFSFVDEQGGVLLLARNDEKADHDLLLAALKREKVDVKLETVEDLSIDLNTLQQYGVVILSNLSADTFNDEQHKALASYVRDSGGGLIMIGGDQSFGAGGWIGKPVEEVSPVNFDIRQKRVIPRGALAIIMHSCESPQGNDYGEKAAIATVETLSSQDYLGVITYNWGVGGANWDVPMSLLSDKAEVIRKMKDLQIGDMPDFGTTMQMAVDGLLQAKSKGASQLHMIIISDGDPQAPSNAIIDQMIKNRITASTIGIGYGGAHCFESTLIDIARRTSGDPRKFFRCTNPRTLPQIFIKEAKVIRRTLLSEEPFTPTVAQYDMQTVQGVADGPMPQLRGLVLTEPKADIIMPLVRKSADGTIDPLLAYRRFEMGKMAVFTSGLWKKWGTGWAQWEKFGRFWSQLIHWCMRQSSGMDFDVTTRLDGNTGKIVVEALKKDASYLNFLQIGGRLVLPNMETQPLYLVQTGPGQYEATFDVVDTGNYLINLKYTDPDKTTGLILSGLSVPYSQEFRELQTNAPLLERIVTRSGGRKLAMDPVNDKVFDPTGLPPAEMRQPVWRWVVTWLLIPLFLLDVAVRRLASTLAMSIYVELAVLVVLIGVLYTAGAGFWGYLGALVLAELVGWTIRRRYIIPTIDFFTSSVTSLARAGQRSAQSLSHLKGVREKVREDLTAKPDTEEARRDTVSIPLEPAADPRKRFEVDEETAAKPAGDLTESLGGAVATEADETTKPSQRPGRKPAGQEDVTGRLLKAKRRARDQIEDEKKES